jgi:hypothetical protein
MSRDAEAVASAVLAELWGASRRHQAWMTASRLAAALRAPRGEVDHALAVLAERGQAERALFESAGKVVVSWRALHVTYAPFVAE